MAYSEITMEPGDAFSYETYRDKTEHVLYFPLDDFLALINCSEWAHYFVVDSLGIRYIDLDEISGLSKFPVVLGSVKQGYYLAEKLNYLMPLYDSSVTKYIAVWYDLDMLSGVRTGAIATFTGSLLRGVE